MILGRGGGFFLGRGSDFDESTSLDRSEPLDGCLIDEICCVIPPLSFILVEMEM